MIVMQATVLQDFDFVFKLRIPHLHTHQEAIHLAFWQRKGALVIDRILGRDHHKWRRHRVSLAIHRELPASHHFQ